MKIEDIEFISTPFEILKIFFTAERNAEKNTLSRQEGISPSSLSQNRT
jgi:hypothetical protein